MKIGYWTTSLTDNVRKKLKSVMWQFSQSGVFQMCWTNSHNILAGLFNTIHLEDT